MPDYTDRQKVESFILADYLDVVETKKPGILSAVVAEVSGEIDSALGRRYVVPFAPVPELVRYIASVLAAWRVAGSLTTLVDTEASSDNEWLPLQREWKRATLMLDEFASGRRLLPPPAVELVQDREDAAVAVVSRPSFFDLRGL